MAPTRCLDKPQQTTQIRLADGLRIQGWLRLHTSCKRVVVGFAATRTVQSCVSIPFPKIPFAPSYRPLYCANVPHRAILALKYRFTEHRYRPWLSPRASDIRCCGHCELHVFPAYICLGTVNALHLHAMWQAAREATKPLCDGNTWSACRRCS
jgi:hypothetical protein